MQVRHEFSRGDLVLAKAEGHPHWPAKVQSCLKNGSYRVTFFGEKSEATVLPQMVLDFAPAHAEPLRRGKDGKNKALREALKLAERVAEERLRGNYEFEDEVLMGRRTLSRRRRQDTSRSLAKESTLNRTLNRTLSRSMAEQTSITLPLHREANNLLDKLVKHCASCHREDSPPLFSPQDASRLTELLSAESGLTLREVIDRWVLERMILALRAIDQWGIPLYVDLGLRLRERYSELAETILSEEFQQVAMESSRKERTMERVRQFRVDVGRGSDL